jgi:hypothetical protein
MHHAMKTWGSGGMVPYFFTSALDGAEWSASRPGRFTPGERRPDTDRIRDWVVPRVGLDTVEERRILTLTGIEPRPSST